MTDTEIHAVVYKALNKAYKVCRYSQAKQGNNTQAMNTSRLWFTRLEGSDKYTRMECGKTPNAKVHQAHELERRPTAENCIYTVGSPDNGVQIIT